jgi:hypothetical protein
VMSARPKADIIQFGGRSPLQISGKDRLQFLPEMGPMDLWGAR